VQTFAQACAAAPYGEIWQVAENLHNLGVPQSDASSWARMCTNIDAGAQLGATGHFNGLARRGPWVIAVHHNPTGHFLQLRRRYPSGAHTLTVSPADTTNLLRHWRANSSSTCPPRLKSSPRVPATMGGGGAARRTVAGERDRD
jgi:hypothetical protein